MGQWGRIRYEDGYRFIPHVKTGKAFGPIKNSSVIDFITLLDIYHKPNISCFNKIRNKYIGMTYGEYLGKEKTMPKKERKFIVLKDIVIPRGTVLKRAPIKTERDEEHFDTIIGLSNNTCGNFEYHMDPDYTEELEEYFIEIKE